MVDCLQLATLFVPRLPLGGWNPTVVWSSPIGIRVKKANAATSLRGQWRSRESINLWVNLENRKVDLFSCSPHGLEEHDAHGNAVFWVNAVTKLEFLALFQSLKIIRVSLI
uniref:Uncharacterized protein n=1 Tax=Physcomitrium patens TaxID=3218 RepID=A0A2K1JXL9_PHYPA|nr:hypothetical protein PHYPA_013392 [Physcomitrium patens]